MEIPAAVAHLIGINSEFAVLLCRSAGCRHAQTVRGIAEHLRKVHHESPALRREAEDFGWELARQDARFLCSYTDVELPVNGSSPQHIVPVVDGYSCRFCGYLTVSRAQVRMHVNRVHSKPREEDDRISTRVRLQSWYGPKRERYWVVRDATERSREGTNATNGSGHATSGVNEATNRQDDATDSLDGIKEDVRRWRGEATIRRLTLQVEPQVYELDSWLNFTKWHSVLSKSRHDMLQTYKFLCYPEPEETKMLPLLRAWDIIKARALDTLEDVDHKDALKWWVSPKNEVASQNPFELPQSARTLDQYSRMWEQFLCYMLRTVPPESEDPTETGVTYTLEQRQAIEDIQDSLDDDKSDADLPA